MNKSIQRKEVMTPAHKKWDEFRDRLEGPEGCNYHYDEKGAIEHTCTGGIERPLARKILDDMGMDVDKSFDYFNDHGGYCDCEILYNVSP